MNEIRSKMSSGGFVTDLEGPAVGSLSEGQGETSALQACEARRRAEKEIHAALDLLGREAIWVREGAGAENPYASLAVTMSRLHELLGAPEGRVILHRIPCHEETLPPMDAPVLIYVASLPKGKRWNRAERRAHGYRKWSWAGGQSGWAPQEVTYWMALPAELDETPGRH